MIFDNPYDYLANYLTIDEAVPYEQSKSGARDEHKPIYQDNVPYNSNPILRLDDNITNYDGYGLKKGYYELRPDNDFKFLMFIQSGTIKAKIPVISYERISDHGDDYRWPDDKKGDKNTPNSASAPFKNTDIITASKPYIKPLTKKEAEARKKKYKKGADPINYIHSGADIMYDAKTRSYIVVWEKYNFKVTGIIKL